MDLVFSSGLAIALFIVVAIILICLIYVMAKQGAILRKLDEKKENVDERQVSFNAQAEAPPSASVVSEAEEDSEELIAVISAAVAEALGKPSSQVIVKSIRRMGQVDQSWVLSGRRDIMDTRF